MSRKREAMNYFSIESAVALLVSLFINVSQAHATLMPPACMSACCDYMLEMQQSSPLAVMGHMQVCVVTVFAKAFFGKGVADIGLANAGQYISDKYGHIMVRLTAAASNG